MKSPFFRRQNPRSEGLAVILLFCFTICYVAKRVLEEESYRLSGFGKVKIIISELVRRQLTVRKEKIPFPRKEKDLILRIIKYYLTHSLLEILPKNAF